MYISFIQSTSTTACMCGCEHACIKAHHEHINNPMFIYIYIYPLKYITNLIQFTMCLLQIITNRPRLGI